LAVPQLVRVCHLGSQTSKVLIWIPLNLLIIAHKVQIYITSTKSSMWHMLHMCGDMDLTYGAHVLIPSLPSPQLLPPLSPLPWTILSPHAIFPKSSSMTMLIKNLNIAVIGIGSIANAMGDTGQGCSYVGTVHSSTSVNLESGGGE